MLRTFLGWKQGLGQRPRADSRLRSLCRPAWGRRSQGNQAWSRLVSISGGLCPPLSHRQEVTGLGPRAFKFTSPLCDCRAPGSQGRKLVTCR